MIIPLLLSLFSIYLVLSDSDEGIIAIDFGSANIVTGMIGGKLNFELVPSETGKRKIPSIVTLDGVQRFAGNRGYEKVSFSSKVSFSE